MVPGTRWSRSFHNVGLLGAFVTVPALTDLQQVHSRACSACVSMLSAVQAVDTAIRLSWVRLLSWGLAGSSAFDFLAGLDFLAAFDFLAGDTAISVELDDGHQAMDTVDVAAAWVTDSGGHTGRGFVCVSAVAPFGSGPSRRVLGVH